MTNDKLDSLRGLIDSSGDYLKEARRFRRKVRKDDEAEDLVFELESAISFVEQAREAMKTYLYKRGEKL